MRLRTRIMFVALFSFTSAINAQIKIVDINDTLLINSRIDFKIDTINSYNTVFLLDFKDTLNDGFYKIISKGNNIYATGQFVNKKKQGQFNYYRDKNLILTYTYDKGLLNGKYIYYRIYKKKRIISEEGYYINGKMNGIFSYYNSKGLLEKQKYYSNDVLLSYVYNINNRVYFYKKNADIEVFSYQDSIDWEEFIFTKGKFISYKSFWPSGIIKTIIIPKQDATYHINSDIYFPDININAIIGTRYNYDPNGHIIE